LLYILWGQDDYSLTEALGEIKRGLGDPELLATNTTTFDGQQLTTDQMRTTGETLPFLAEKRLVIVRGLLERFEPNGRASRRQKNTRSANHRNECESLVAGISQLPESTLLVLIEGRITSRNPLLRGLSAKAKVKSFPLLRGAQLRQWIQRRVAAGGGTISPKAIELLAQLVGSNLWIMASEIDKLTLFASGRRIEEEDVRAVVSDAQQASVFTMVDAILEARAGRAGQALHQLLQRGSSPVYLLAMLSRQARMIVRVKELTSQGGSETEIRNRLGLTSDFARQKTIEQAGRYSLGRLKDLYHKLLEADLAIKTGKYEGELALNILIAELCQPDRAPTAHSGQI